MATLITRRAILVSLLLSLSGMIRTARAESVCSTTKTLHYNCEQLPCDTYRDTFSFIIPAMVSLPNLSSNSPKLKIIDNNNNVLGCLSITNWMATLKKSCDANDTKVNKTLQPVDDWLHLKIICNGGDVQFFSGNENLLVTLPLGKEILPRVKVENIQPYGYSPLQESEATTPHSPSAPGISTTSRVIMLNSSPSGQLRDRQIMLLIKLDLGLVAAAVILSLAMMVLTINKI
ncbi:hypothetical protein Hamer_G002134 [Homarus americanus]|uniref:Uncharacterized protein n=1 Tax=Homarus americanus TaxID=6706 RepID=A0A8J5JRR0_HOMAM|nr:hypothetical protein Hamer_G002134 [Homarus americanus]